MSEARAVVEGIRARWSKGLLAWMEREGGIPVERALETLSPATRALVTESSAVAWLPLEAHFEMLAALEHGFGAAGFREAYTLASMHALALPVFDGILAPLVRLMGARALAHGLPPAWDQSLRGLGSIEVPATATARLVEVRLVGVPELRRDGPLLRESMHGLLEAIRRRASIEGTIAADYADADEGTFRYELRLAPGAGEPHWL
ncbi:MAG: hypothetical protein K1X94_09175 [Sandaracinaceae bacterium]|nr:hypothetical protein [Sandaracinaceae bacterium]